MASVFRTTRTVRRVIFAAAVVVQLVALYLPQVPAVGGVAVPGADKAVHLLVFALVMLTGLLAGVPARWLAPLLAGHAVLSELIQHLLLPGRTGDPMDVVADLGGIALGWYLASMVGRHGLAGPAGESPAGRTGRGDQPDETRA